MKISGLRLPKPALDFLDSQGFKKLYPPQADSVKAGLLDGRSVLVSSPTASGKTLIAIMSILSHFSKGSGRVVYLSPLRALAAEKYAEFKKMEKITSHKIRVAMSVGDLDAGQGLNSSNVLVLTNERMDSLIRHGTRWIDDIAVVIVDEIHLIGDPDRGPTLEMVLTRLKKLNPRPQIIGLSATVTNSEEIAGWLDCTLVKSDWRPVRLYEGVYDDGQAVMQGGKNFEVTPVHGPPVDLAIHCVKDDGQSLVFAETRVRCASLATKAAGSVARLLTPEQIKSLDKTSKQILKNNEDTDLVKRLAGLVRQGTAFHHAGLSQNCRQTIENEFRNGSIRLISSTPTLAAGVNLPARRVVIASVSRYNFRSGINSPISILEYKQLCGRAGRPQYDDYGESIIVPGNNNPDDLVVHYIDGEPEPIMSKIADDKALQIHILSFLVTNPARSQDDVVDFFTGTLGGMQQNRASLKLAVRTAMRFLIYEKLLYKKGQQYIATDFGKKTSQLYLDPQTAISFRDTLEITSPGKHTLGFLHLISNCAEFFPQLAQRIKDADEANLLVEQHRSEMITPISGDDCSRSLLALYHWITESSDRLLSDTFKVEPGDMHRMAETAGRLAYCLREIAREQHPGLLLELGRLRRRIKNGIRDELVSLVGIRGIGRVRARALFNHGIKSVADLRRTPVESLAGVDKIGIVLARKIKSELAVK